MTLPPDFILQTKDLLGNDFLQLETALQEEAPVSVRLNKPKGVDSLDYERVLWSETGYYLPKRLAFTFDPLFHAGAYYVQEASSMFLEQAVKTYVSEPVRCLDLCAAPGGKSTHLLSVLPEGSLLVSNEVIRSRSNILSENLIKWGNPCTVVTNNDPADLGKLTHFFDVVVTDVPCSGEGMFRKDPESMKEWSLSNVKLCAARQKRILQDVWSALKPGGILIYSTCTYNTEENEDNIHYITNELGAEALSIPINKEWQITDALKYNYPVYRFFPHKTRGEGFFLAILRKKEDTILEPRTKPKKEKRKDTYPIPSEIKKWLLQPETFTIEINGNIVQAFPSACQAAYNQLSKQLSIVSAGIRLGELKGKDIQPSQSLAMSTMLHPTAFPTAELSWEQAIHYLKREPLQLPNEKGYILVTHQKHPLGFAKQIGNRANNLYPQEWRIRSGYIPQEGITL